MRLKVIVSVTVNIGMWLRVVWWMCTAVSKGRVINDIVGDGGNGIFRNFITLIPVTLCHIS